MSARAILALGALGALAALGACASAYPIVVEELEGGRDVLVRVDPAAADEARAAALAGDACGAEAAFVTRETRFDGLTYLRYHCAQEQAP